MSKRDIVSIRGRKFPELRGDVLSQRALLAKERRKRAQKRYRESVVGTARREKRQAIKKVNSALTREFMTNHPEVVEEYKGKYFTKRLDGLGEEKGVKNND